MDLRYNESFLEIRSEDNKPVLRGLASPVYDGTARTEYKLGPKLLERFAKGAFDKFLATNPTIDARYNHDPARTIAMTPDTLKVWSSNRGLEFEAQLNPDVSFVRDLISQVKDKVIKGASIRFAPIESKWTKEGDTEIRTVTEAIVEEVSPVYRPAYQGTTAIMRSLDDWHAAEATRVREEKVKEILNSLSLPKCSKDTK